MNRKADAYHDREDLCELLRDDPILMYADVRVTTRPATFDLIDLDSLLPDVTDPRDDCIIRLQSLIGEQRGIIRAHVREQGDKAPSLCLHYNPALLTLAQVVDLAKLAGLQITERFGHVIIPFRLLGGEDAARRIEADLSSIDGVVSVSANLPAQALRVECDRQIVPQQAVMRRVWQLSLGGEAPGEGSQPGENAEHAGVEHAGSWYARNKQRVWCVIAFALLGAAWFG